MMIPLIAELRIKSNKDYRLISVGSADKFLLGNLLRSAEPLELLGQCVLKLKTPPHEDSSFTEERIKDADLVRFYISDRDGIMSLYGEERLRGNVLLVRCCFFKMSLFGEKAS
jgi:hypothetical protein